MEVHVIMRKLLIGLMLTLGLSLPAVAGSRSITGVSDQTVVKRATGIEQSRSGHLDDNLYFESWEDGFGGWTPIDLTADPASWHLDNYQAFGGTGTSWWVGDPGVGDFGGYEDDWYMALDSPPITLGDSPEMIFWHRYSCEDPEGADPPYNGWDGMNIRISTDDGFNWTIIPTANVNPAYTRSSLYSFGLQHGEGPNIPGWCDTTNGLNWQRVEADLSTWANQTVKIRWAFASDPSYCTRQNNHMFGWMVDNVRVFSGADTVFSHDAEDDTGWETRAVRPVGGDLWRIAVDATSPEGPNVLMCNDPSDGLYYPDMNDAIESPYIDLTELAFGTVMADFLVTGSVDCISEEYPDCDYWSINVSSDSGVTWCTIPNPTCDPEGVGYNYIDAPSFWAYFNDSYTHPVNVSALLGHVIKFQLQFESNPDDDVDIGPRFDGFTVDYEAAFPNDVTCYTMQVRYPTNAGRAFVVKAYFENLGANAQDAVPAYYNIIGQTTPWSFTDLLLNPGQRDTREAEVIVSDPGTIAVQAWTALAADEDLENDTSSVMDIVVNSSTADLELGYDNRTHQFRFDYETGEGVLVHFTPVSDDVVEPPYDLNTIRVRYDMGQVGNLPIRYHLYTGTATRPVIELWSSDVMVLQSETADWKDVDVSGDPDTQGMTTDFWFWLEVLSTEQEDRYPQVLGDDAEEWDDAHFFIWDGSTSMPDESNYFYEIHANVTDATPAGESHWLGLPHEWSLEQNYPNPFNPVTEIRYAVPEADLVSLKVFNLLGQEVATLVNGHVEPGFHTAVFDGSQLASGVYLYKLESARYTAVQKMMLLK